MILLSTKKNFSSFVCLSCLEFVLFVHALLRMVDFFSRSVLNYQKNIRIYIMQFRYLLQKKKNTKTNTSLLNSQNERHERICLNYVRDKVVRVDSTLFFFHFIDIFSIFRCTFIRHYLFSVALPNWKQNK